MTLKWLQVHAQPGLWKLAIYLEAGGGMSVLQWVVNAREGSWDLQDGCGYVYAYGSGETLTDCQAAATSALYTVLEAIRGQLS